MASQAEMLEMKLLRNRVSDEEIRRDCIKMDGILVSRMLEGEREKLPVRRNFISARHWSDEAVVAAATRCVVTCGFERSHRPNGSFLFLGQPV